MLPVRMSSDGNDVFSTIILKNIETIEMKLGIFGDESIKLTIYWF